MNQKDESEGKKVFILADFRGFVKGFFKEKDLSLEIKVQEVVTKSAEISSRNIQDFKWLQF